MKHAVIAILLATGAIIAMAAATGTPGGDNIPVVRERFVTRLEPNANIDSVAVSPASGGGPALLFATAKSTDVIKVFDASSGQELREFGGSGTSPGQFQRPNGVAGAGGWNEADSKVHH